MKLLIKDNSYEVPRSVADNCISLARIANKSRNAIIAVQLNDDFIEMRNDRFKTKEALMKQVKQYEEANIKVHYTIR